jgi:hypothetical protein
MMQVYIWYSIIGNENKVIGKSLAVILNFVAKNGNRI